MTRDPKTAAQLASQLGICERQFFRWLNDKNSKATTALRDDLAESYRDDLAGLATDASIFADKFKRCDLALSRKLRIASNALFDLTNSTPIRDDGEAEIDWAAVGEALTGGQQ